VALNMGKSDDGVWSKWIDVVAVSKDGEIPAGLRLLIGG
jgi:hypothetical protein